MGKFFLVPIIHAVMWSILAPVDLVNRDTKNSQKLIA